jgi:hypothetical protein
LRRGESLERSRVFSKRRLRQWLIQKQRTQNPIRCWPIGARGRRIGSCVGLARVFGPTGHGNLAQGERVFNGRPFRASGDKTKNRVQQIDHWLKSLCVSVDSVRAFLPPDSCAPTFHGGFLCFPGRRKTRTEVTEGLTDTELAGPPAEYAALNTYEPRAKTGFATFVGRLRQELRRSEQKDRIAKIQVSITAK